MSERSRHDILWGARQIGAEINRTERATFHLLEQKNLPARKIGAKWTAIRGELWDFFSGAKGHAK